MKHRVLDVTRKDGSDILDVGSGPLTITIKGENINLTIENPIAMNLYAERSNEITYDPCEHEYIRFVAEQSDGNQVFECTKCGAGV